MQLRVKKSLYALILTIAVSAIAGQDAPVSPGLKSVAPILTQPSMNVFRRFAGNAEPMYEFYGKVLGLKQLTTFDLGARTSVARFQAGASEFKLSGRVPNREYRPGGVEAATGLRLLTFFFPSEGPLEQGFRAQGLPVPEFRPVTGSNRRSAIVNDPDGQAVELAIFPDAPPATYRQIEIGLTVSNIDASRKFYREFVGLEELPPVEDPIYHTTKYSFRHGSTIISLRSFGKQLPADTGSAGIQYVVSDAKAVEDLAKARQVRIAQPISTLPGFGLKTVWLDDPDGITNYFAEIGKPGKPAPPR